MATARRRLQKQRLALEGIELSDSRYQSRSQPPPGRKRTLFVLSQFEFWCFL